MPHDLYHDPAHGILKNLLPRYPGVEPMLKTAEFEDDITTLPDTAFAWPAQRLYPVHTPEHAIVSHLYISASSDTPQTVKLAVAEALLAYGVSKEVVEPVEEKVAEASPDDFLFADGTYPVRGAVEVKYAESRLLQQARRLPLAERVAAFHKLAHAATRHNVTLTPAAQAWGMAGLSDPVKVLDALAARAFLSKTAEDKTLYLQTAESLRKDPTALRGFNAQVKLAQVLLGADRHSGLDKTWDDKIPDPFHTVFNTAVKTGAQLVDLGSGVFDLQALSALPSTFYADALGPEIVGQIAPGGQMDPDQLSAILPTLPADMKASLIHSLASAGLKPMAV